MRHLPVEHLPRELPRLLQHGAAVLRVGVVAEVRALVHETLAVRIDHDAEGIAVLLEAVAHQEVSELRRVPIPPHGVASRPVPVRHRAGVERHADPVPGVEARSPHPREVPAGPEVAGAPLGVRFEPSAGEHDRPPPHREHAVPRAHDDAAHRPGLFEERRRARFVEDLDALAPAGLRQVPDQPGAAAPGLHRQAAPEPEAPAGRLERLAPVGGLEADPLAPHPDQGVEAVLDEDLDKVRMAAVAGDARHVVVVLLARVPPEVGALDLRRGEIHQPGEILDPLERDPHRARGIAAVSPALGLGGRFEHHHLRALLPRRQRGAHRRVARPDHDHVGFAIRHHALLAVRLPGMPGDGRQRRPDATGGETGNAAHPRIATLPAPATTAPAPRSVVTPSPAVRAAGDAGGRLLLTKPGPGARSAVPGTRGRARRRRSPPPPGRSSRRSTRRTPPTRAARPIPAW